MESWKIAEFTLKTFRIANLEDTGYRLTLIRFYDIIIHMSNSNPFNLPEKALTGDVLAPFPNEQTIPMYIANVCNDGTLPSDIVRITDQDWKKVTEGDDEVYYRLYNLAAEADDLQQAVGVGELILTENQHKGIIKSAITETIRFISKYLPLERIQETFPGVDLNKIEEYDLSCLPFSIFILSEVSFNDVHVPSDIPYSNLLFKSGYHIGTHRPDNEPKEGPLGQTKFINTGKSLIVVKENGTPSNHLSTKEGRHKYPSEYKLQIAEQIKSVLIHELLHDLKIGSQFNDELMEALVEFTTILINLDHGPSIYSPQAYPTGIKFIEKLKGMGEFSSSELLQLYISLNEESKPIGKRITNTLERKYGKDVAKRIINFEFENMQEALNYISDLEFQEPIPDEDYSI